MPLTILPGKPLPLHPSYDSDAVARAFWRLSYQCGRGYVDGLDANGHAIIPPHEREKEGYERRKRLTKPRNHSGPIIRRYNDHAFRRKAQRQAEKVDPLYSQLVADADGRGTTIDEFMKRCLRVAQVERECYILADTTAPADGRQVTVAKAEADGIRPVLRRINPDAVPYWRDHGGVLVEAIVLLEDAEGETFAQHYTRTHRSEIRFAKAPDGSLAKPLTVASVGVEVTHSYGGCPLVRQRPLFDDDDASAESQIAPMAQAQQIIANLLSYLMEETCNVTFSQAVATGVSADQVKDVYVGNNRMICVPNPAGAITMIGADPAQSKSIREFIADEERELYRIAGIDAGSSTQAGAPESGVAKAFKHNDLAANLTALSMSCQYAENQAMALVFRAAGKPLPPPVAYPREFDLPALTDELSEAIRAVTTQQLPRVLKASIVRRFAARNFELSPEDSEALEAELDALGDEAPNDPPAARMRGT